mmetsp:Transcript_18628/g.37660  ORF Transcript_18628/g.37660 Transcript_18628/m.37660 type:complete len:219 (-) Transcript_18628:369-1025(-)
MRRLILPNRHEHIVQIIDHRPPQLALRLKLIEHVHIPLPIILDRHPRRFHLLQLLFVLLQELIVRRISVFFYFLVQIVRLHGIEEIQENHDEVIPHGNVLGYKPIEELVVSTQLFHDQQMMQFVPTFSEMQFQILGASPFSQRFVEMEDGEVGEVRDASDGFEGVESGEGALVVGPGEEGVEDGSFEETDGEAVGFFDGVGKGGAEFGGGSDVGGGGV